MAKKVLVTGASGLLGRAVTLEFLSDKSWQVIGLAYSRAEGNLIKLDLRDGAAVKRVFQDIKPDVIIHCAAEKRADFVERQTEDAWKLNVYATQSICQAAAVVGAWVLYISTDYVFDGKSPPYKVDDPVNPLNKYGQSKHEGEQMTLQASQEFGVLRVPILYGHVTSLGESAVTVLFDKVMDTKHSCTMSDYEKRYPTTCGDIAHVVRELAARRLQDKSIKGIYHWSGAEMMTKYDMAVTMAKVFGIHTKHIKGDKHPTGGASRPYNSQLDCSRVEALGIGKRTPFRDAVEMSLRPFYTKK